MKKQKVALGKKLFLDKGTIAQLLENEANHVVGGTLPTEMNCNKSVLVCPATAINGARTQCCPSWPPNCSAFVACVG